MKDNEFKIGNLVTCKFSGMVFNADLIGIKNKSIDLPISKYIVRDYSAGYDFPLGKESMDAYDVPTRFKGIRDWLLLKEDEVFVYDGVARKPPVFKKENVQDSKPTIILKGRSVGATTLFAEEKIVLQDGCGSLPFKKSHKSHCLGCARFEQQIKDRCAQ